MAGGKKGQSVPHGDAGLLLLLLEDTAVAAWHQDMEAGRLSPSGAWRLAAWCLPFDGTCSREICYHEPMVGSEKATSGVVDG